MPNFAAKPTQWRFAAIYPARPPQRPLAPTSSQHYFLVDGGLNTPGIRLVGRRVAVTYLPPPTFGPYSYLVSEAARVTQPLRRKAEGVTWYDYSAVFPILMFLVLLLKKED